MKAFFCELLFSCLAAAPVAPPVEELTYGTVLYAYYQDDYQTALLNAMIAEDQGRQGDNPIRFQLAKGSFAFNDGMYQMAESVFAEVDPAELTELDRLRLSFHLARELYRRRDWPRLEAELAKVELGKTWLGRAKFHPEVEFMRAEVSTMKGDFPTATTLLQRLDEDNALRAYGLYNLGVAQNEAGALADAEVTFTSLAQMPADNDETYDLIQRSKLAIAYLKKNQGKNAEAEAVLDALPVGGRYRDVALATYGSLAMNTENYELAARIWLTLQNQDYWNPSTATARLGFPTSLERVASMDMALTQYRTAEESFEGRLVKLNQLSDEASDPTWVRGLLQVFSTPTTPDGDAAGMVIEQWQERLGHTDWLEWLSAEEVHEVLSDWRLLNEQKAWLDVLPDRMATLQEVSDERHRRSAQARRVLDDEGLLERRAQVVQVLEELRNKIAQVDATAPSRDFQWMLALANSEERKLLEKLDAMRQTIARAGERPDQARSLSRIDRIEGMVFWDIANSRSQRIREAQKAMLAGRDVLDDIETRVDRVERAEGVFIAGTETNYLSFVDRAEVLTARIDGAIADREEVLANEIRRGMQRESRQVEQYLLATRIAIARATDLLGLNADSPK